MGILNSLDLKIRISILWIFMAVAISAHGILSFMELSSEEMVMGSGMLFFTALFWWVPLVMSFLSLTLKENINRRLNQFIGGIFTILNFIHLIEHLSKPSAHQLLIIGSTVVVAALIVWYSWKWPKEML